MCVWVLGSGGDSEQAGEYGREAVQGRGMSVLVRVYVLMWLRLWVLSLDDWLIARAYVYNICLN